jgi:hypothetical protein
MEGMEVLMLIVGNSALVCVEGGVLMVWNYSLTNNKVHAKLSVASVKLYNA